MPWHVRVTPCSSTSPGFRFSVPPACRSVLNSLRPLHDYSLLSFSRVQLFATPRTAASQASLSFTISQSLLKLISIKSVSPSNHLILCHPLLLLPSIFASIREFFNESALLIRWPKYWSFSFGISPSSEFSGLISCRIDWFDLLVVQETLESSLSPQFKSISFSALSLVYDPTLTSLYD